MNGESDCHTLWHKEIQCLGIPGANIFKKDFIPYLERFDKIYIHDEKDTGGKKFVERACQLLPYEKLYTICSKKIDASCKDPSDLHIAGLLNKDTLLGTAEKIDKFFYDEANSKEEKKEEDVQQDITEVSEKFADHVILGEKIMKTLYIKFYRERFYVYDNGVYHENLPLIERTILSINKNVRKTEQNEVLNYIRIKTYIDDIQINEQFVNFCNGLYDLVNHKLIKHSPLFFTTSQIHANYFEDNEMPYDKYVKQFIDGVACHDPNRIKALLQIIGYCITFRVDMQKAFFFYRSYR